ncbi:MAG: Gx transporter family protein [Synergistaceae bacterium]|jgi:heptaprenyl diphosphate synthase|nr:Gx transporter family protein [Synergistaceae bacterium]
MGKTFAVRDIALMGLMLSMILMLAAVESMLPSLPLNMRFGLSNAVTMYALFFVGRRSALALAALKSVFTLFMRGPIAGLMSLGGGICSLCAIAALASAWPGASYFILSIAGALTHNLAQIAVASWLVSTNLMPVYLPVMTALGIPAGALTAVLLRVAMPVFKNISARRDAPGAAKNTEAPGA